MIIKSLKLKNIRSYKEADLAFPKGTILFEGDIGAGKSTVLHAIEFALFGFSDIDSEFILRRGESKAMVELEMEMDGRAYGFHREIQGNLIKKCWIETDSARTEYSSEEMKAEILKILKFRDKSSGKSRVLTYRYAFFTPQESMKEILGASRDERLDTLRKAFGVEEYRIARDNAKEFRRTLAPEIASLEGQALDLEEKERVLREAQAQKATAEDDLATLEKSLAVAAAELKHISEEKKTLDEMRIRKARLEKETAEKRGAAGSWQERIRMLEDALKQAESAEQKMKELAPAVERYKAQNEKLREAQEKKEKFLELQSEIAGLRATISQIEKQIAEQSKRMEALPGFREQKEKLEKETAGADALKTEIEIMAQDANATSACAAKLESEMADLENEKRELSGISGKKECPKCHQALTKEHLERVVGEIEAKASERREALAPAQKKYAELAATRKQKESELSRLDVLRRRLVQIETRIEELEKSDNRVILDERRKEAQAKAAALERETAALKFDETQEAKLRAEIASMEPSVSEFNIAKHLAERKAQAQERLAAAKAALEKAMAALVETEAALRELESQYSEEQYIDVSARHMAAAQKYSASAERVDGKKKETAALERILTELSRELERKREAKRQMAALQERSGWIDAVICPALESIENHMLASINQEFSEQFRSFFAIMLEGSDMDVDIDADFTPTIRQNGYEQDYGNLSGGEKTSVALAYRLALNAMVKKVSLAGSASLLILDEPTDGFSKEQIYKLRDVFERTNCDQIIVVSHEKELEGLVDKIFEIRKEGGVSRIVEK